MITDNFFLNKKKLLFFLVIFFSSIHGILYIYPDFIQIGIANNLEVHLSFNDSWLSPNEDETIYGPHIRRYFDFFLNGNLYLNNPTSLNQLSNPNYQFLAPLIGGFLSYLFGSVENFFYYKNFIFPALNYLLLYFLIQTLFKSSIISLFGAFLICNPFFNFSDLFNYITFNENLWQHKKGFESITKYPSHQLTSLFYFLGLISIFNIQKNKRYKYLLIFSIVCSAYSYVYSFAVLGLQTLILFIYNYFKKNNCSRDFFISGFISLILSLPFLISLLFQEFKNDLLLSFGLTNSIKLYFFNHLIKLLIILTFLIAILKIFPKYIEIIVFFITALIPGAFFIIVAYNTLFVVEAQHFTYEYRIIKTLIFLFIFYIFQNLDFKHLSKIANLSLIVLSLCVYINAFNYQKNISKNKPDIYPKETMELYSWIKKETEIDSSIATIDSFLLHTIPTYTGRYNFYPSLKSLSPTKIDYTFATLYQTKEFFNFKDSFYSYFKESCPKIKTDNKKIIKNSKKFEELSYFCEYLFFSYFEYDKGSLFYKQNKSLIPKEIVVPEKNNIGNFVKFIPNYYFDKYFKKINTIKNPDYLVIGNVEKKYLVDHNYINNYKKVFSNKMYSVYESKN